MLRNQFGSGIIKKCYICFVRRFISFIFAIYFMGLSMITCSDVSSGIDNCGKAQTHLHASSDQSKDTHDICTPFCMCHCCGGITLIYMQSLEFKQPINSLNNFQYCENSLSDISYSIWQPPKV